MTSTSDELMHNLLHGDPETAIRASIELSKQGPSVVESLIAILRDVNLRHLWWLIVCPLAQTGDRRAIEPLIDILEKPTPSHDWLTRKYTAYALAQLPDARAVDALIGMLHDRLYDEEEEENGSLQIYDERDVEGIEAACGALIAIGEWRGLQAVIERLLEEDEYWFDHRMKEWAGDTGFQYFVKALETADEGRKKRVAQLLGESGDHRATPVLISLAQKYPSGQIHLGAINGLSSLIDPEGFSTLLLALAHVNTNVRFAAALGIDKFFIDDIYKPASEETTPAALLNKALKEIGMQEVTALLWKASQDTNTVVRATAITLQNTLSKHSPS